MTLGTKPHTEHKFKSFTILRDLSDSKQTTKWSVSTFDTCAYKTVAGISPLQVSGSRNYISVQLLLLLAKECFARTEDKNSYPVLHTGPGHRLPNESEILQFSFGLLNSGYLIHTRLPSYATSVVRIFYVCVNFMTPSVPLLLAGWKKGYGGEGSLPKVIYI